MQSEHPLGRDFSHAQSSLTSTARVRSRPWWSRVYRKVSTRT